MNKQQQMARMSESDRDRYEHETDGEEPWDYDTGLDDDFDEDDELDEDLEGLDEDWDT